MDVKLLIDEKEYTIEEAKVIYNELKLLFNEKTPYVPWCPPVNVPWVQPYPTPVNPYYTITTTGGDETWSIPNRMEITTW